MKNNKDLAILVLSCDKYSDLWDDFFNLKEQHWPDCPYPTYVATDSVQYERPGVQVIHFGNIRTWTVCARKAIEKIDSHYIALFLEDAFIYKKIDSSIIEVDVQIMKEKGIDFLTLERDRTNKHTPNETPIAFAALTSSPFGSTCFC